MPSKSRFLLGAVCGGILGAGLVLLITPRTGAQLRRQLADWSAEKRVSVESTGPVSEAVDLARLLLQSSIERVETAIRDAREAREAVRRHLTAEWRESIGPSDSGQVRQNFR